MHLLSFFVFNQLLLLAHGLRNVTLDDNDPQIQYTGGWDRTVTTDLDYGGSHLLATNTTSEATLQFTGVAVYFMSPLWPYVVSTALTLDSRPTVVVDLTDHNSPDAGGGLETVQSSVVWSAENLENTTHTLRISVGRGEQFAIVDGIIYTVLEPGDSLPGSFSDNSKDGHIVVIIVLAVLLGILTLILLGLLLWLCLRKRDSPRNTRRASVASSGKWGGDARGGRTRGDDASVDGDSPIRSPDTPSAAPRPPPPPSRPDSDYQPRETAWSTSSVGGPGIPNMTGVGVSTRNSRATSWHPGDPMHSSSHYGTSQGELVDAYAQGPYTNPNHDPRHPNA